MKQSIGFCQFTDAFRNMERENNFSYNGLKALFDYLENLGEDTGQEIELDVIAFCCEYTEYKDLAEFQNNYNDCETMEDIENHTTVIRIDDESFIIQDY